MHLQLHLSQLHVCFAHLLPLAGNLSLVVTFFLGQLSLILSGELTAQLFDLGTFLCSEFLPEDFLHFLVDIVGGLGVVHDLLLLHLHLLASQSCLEFALLRALDDLAFELDLLLQATDLLAQYALPLVSLELVFLGQDLFDLSLLGLARLAHLLLELVDEIFILAIFIPRDSHLFERFENLE